MDEVDLTDFFLLRMPMLKSCPHFLRARLRESFGAALAERHRAKSAGDELGESRAWKLFGSSFVVAQNKGHWFGGTR